MNLMDFFSSSESLFVFISGVVVSSIFVMGISYQLYGKTNLKKMKITKENVK